MIVIYPAQPEPEEEHYENWLRELIAHELTHIIQLDRTDGFPAFLRRIFGRIVINNAAQPIWFIEGLAVNMESKLTNGGRLNSTHFNMLLNKEITGNRLKTIDRASNFPLIWPGSVTPYLYGTYFVDWLEKKYGDSAVILYNKHTSKGIPFVVNSAAKRAFGKDFQTLWNEWENELTSKVTRTHIYDITPITKDGQWNLSPSYSPVNGSIAFIHRSFDDYPGIDLIDTLTKEKRQIVDGYIISGISWSKNGKTILFSRLDVQNFSRFTNIYEYNIAHRSLKKINKTERGRYPVYTPDGRGILFVKEHCGSCDLCIVYPEDDSLITLIHNDDHTQYHYPQFSADGKNIILSVWKKKEGEQIYMLNLSEQTFHKITTQGDNFCPLLSEKYNGIFYISDRTGTYQLYFYSFNDKKTYQFKNHLTGMLYPSLSADEKNIVFTLYTPEGYNIFTKSLTKEQLTLSKNKKISRKRLTFLEENTNTWMHPYNPFPYLLPRFWLPYPVIKGNSINPGFITLSQDVLLKHIIFLYLAYFIPEKKPIYDFSYTNNTKRPSLYLELSSDFPYSINGEWVKEKEKNIFITFSQNNTTFSHSITSGYERDIYSIRNETVRFSDIVLGYHFSNSIKYPRSIEYERGGYLTLTYRYYSKKLWGDYSFQNLLGRSGIYIKTPFKHNVLSFMIASGISISHSTNIGRMSIGGNNENFTVRGYPSDVYFGKFITKGSITYSLPLFWIEKGITTYPIYFRNFQARVFSDAGSSAKEFPPDGLDPLLMSFGMETTLLLDLFYSQVPCKLTTGIAVKKDEIKPSFYFTISTRIPNLSHNTHILSHTFSKAETTGFIAPLDNKH